MEKRIQWWARLFYTLGQAPLHADRLAGLGHDAAGIVIVLAGSVATGF